MYLYKAVPSLVFLSIFMSACGSDNGSVDETVGDDPVETVDEEVVPKSFDVDYTSISVLGSNVNDAVATDAGPEVCSNHLELYFHSDRDGGSGLMDLYVSTRASAADGWGPATNLGATVNTGSDERSPALTVDCLTMFFASDRVDSQGDLDLYMSTRAAIGEPWTAPVNLGVAINTTSKESSPDISPDGLSLYFLSDVPGGYGQNDLYVSTRATLGDAWAMPVNLGEIVNSADYEAAPEVASDGLTLYFHSLRPDVIASQNIWRSTRPTVEDGWQKPMILPMPVNSSGVDVEPGLSSDWQTLYFANDSNGSRDIWQAVP